MLFTDPLALRLVLHLRLPRVVAGLFLGCALAASGTVFQMIFSNPLVEPGFLGVSPGAAFGAALCLVAISSNQIVIQLLAFLSGLTGLALSYFLARLFRYGGWILRLVLAGIAVSALFSAGIGVLKFTADPMNELPEITFWLLGGLWGITWEKVLFILAPTVLGLLVIYIYRWKLNILSLDERVAHALGVSPHREKLLLLLSATLATSAVVSVSGLVGWVGLMVPHLARRIVGADARRAVPVSMILGSTYILFCDALARTVLLAEIPLGILSSFGGACLFLFLMISRNRERGG